MKRNTMPMPGGISTLTAAPLATPAVEHDHGLALGLADPRDRRIIADALRTLPRERSDALAFALRGYVRSRLRVRVAPVMTAMPNRMTATISMMCCDTCSVVRPHATPAMKMIHPSR
ncbi:hypothetical protein [Burkholderia sp. BCC1977]|uniref:hypothetical protein n=1 Tax=Burkholderia sp. BCC1977 TaxID=2817440 RepID=UPI002ABE94FF|nr:hypothetical protein [Burkholderia sp. BCC1977]